MHWYGDEMKAEAMLMHLGLLEEARQVRVHKQDELGPVFEHLEDWMRLSGYLHRDIFAVRLILQEALTNALLHGNGNDPAKCVELTYLVTLRGVIADVQDQGAGFNPGDVVNQFAKENWGGHCGRGVFLMRIYSTWLSFNKTGNRVTICRRRTETR